MKIRILRLCFLSFFGGLMGCVTATYSKHDNCRMPASWKGQTPCSQPSHFPSRGVAQVGKTLVTHQKFAFAEKNAITYEIYKVGLGIADALDEFNFTYSIEFPALSQTQYEILMKRFGGQNLVRWQPGRRYQLIDFLPPKIQALVNRTLEQNYISFDIPVSWRNPLRPYEHDYETGMACWDAAYEVARDLSKPFKSGVSEGYFFHIGAPIVDSVLKNEKYYDVSSKKVLSGAELSPGGAGKVGRNQGRQLGDVLLIDTMVNQDLGAAHAMVWLDDDLYFEKSDMGSMDSFRIVFYEDGLRFWIPNMAEAASSDFPPRGTFYRYPKGLPDVTSFTAKNFYLNEDEEPLDPEIASKYIWNMDVGMGGGLSIFRINPVLKFKMAQDQDGRAFFPEQESSRQLIRRM